MPNILTTIQSWTVQPKVVSAEWLVECTKKGCLVDEVKKYSFCTELPANKDPINIRANTSAANFKKPAAVPNPDESTLKLDSDNGDNSCTVIDEELINKYMSDINDNDASSAAASKVVNGLNNAELSTLPDSQVTPGSVGIFKGQSQFNWNCKY